MKSILYIKRNQQLITEENLRRDFFRFIQDNGKVKLREILDNSELGQLLNESVVSVIRDETKFMTGDSYKRLFEFAALLNKKWKKKDIRIMVINQLNFHSEFINALNEWNKCTGIDFVMANGYDDSDVRISFEENQGHWSYIGNEAEDSSLIGKPTVNFDPKDLNRLDSNSIKAIILHEIGHSLGLIHEPQKDNSPIIWNKSQVYQDCYTWYGWDKAMVNHNIFNTYNSNDLFYSKEFDIDSIMIYAIPHGWSTNYQINQMNKELSIYDKKFAKAFYI